MSIWPRDDIVPVLTFHSVGMNEPGWVWKELSETATAFDRLLNKLRASGYRTVGLSDLYAHMAGQERCPPKSLVLVFDDGYLDNWVTVYPLLKKYGMKGTVYVNPEFVDPGSELRPTMDDTRVTGGSQHAVPQTGFMNWAELRMADETGILDVQSHSLTHTWYFTGPTIVDYYRPSSARSYPWMAWNARPDRKPFYLQEDQTAFVPWGTPVFEHEKSLLARRFEPDPAATQAVIEAVDAGGGRAFFERADWRQQLDSIIAGSEGSGHGGQVESEADYAARVRYELKQSKSVIEQKLGKRVEYLCWPGGGTNDLAKTIAAEVGYKAWTLPSYARPGKRNRPGEDAREIKRLPALRDVRFWDRKWGVGSEQLVVYEMLAHQDSRFFDALRKLYKVGVAVGIVGQRQAG